MQARVIVLTLVLICIVSACKGNENLNGTSVPTISSKPTSSVESRGGDASVGDKIKIGFSMDTLREERWLKDRDLFKEAVEALGGTLKIE